MSPLRLMDSVYLSSQLVYEDGRMRSILLLRRYWKASTRIKAMSIVDTISLILMGYFRGIVCSSRLSPPIISDYQGVISSNLRRRTKSQSNGFSMGISIMMIPLDDCSTTIRSLTHSLLRSPIISEDIFPAMSQDKGRISV
jgi:hypothetical protein